MEDRWSEIEQGAERHAAIFVVHLKNERVQVRCETEDEGEAMEGRGNKQ